MSIHSELSKQILYLKTICIIRMSNQSMNWYGMFQDLLLNEKSAKQCLFEQHERK